MNGLAPEERMNNLPWKQIRKAMKLVWPIYKSVKFIIDAILNNPPFLAAMRPVIY